MPPLEKKNSTNTILQKQTVLNEDELRKIRAGELMPMPEVILKDDAALEAVLAYIKAHLKSATKAEKTQIARMVERYLEEADEKERVDSEVIQTFQMFADKSRNVISLAGGAVTWMKTGNMTLAFVIYAALFALFGPLARKALNRVETEGIKNLEISRKKLLESIRPKRR